MKTNKTNSEHSTNSKYLEKAFQHHLPDITHSPFLTTIKGLIYIHLVLLTNEGTFWGMPAVTAYYTMNLKFAFTYEV